MFSEATERTSSQVVCIAGTFETYPQKGKKVSEIKNVISAGILINQDGWVLTCKHFVDGMLDILKSASRSYRIEKLS